MTSNLYPKEVASIVEHMLEGRWSDARSAHLGLLPVHRAMFVEPNPAPMKAALAARGHMSATVRAPLVDMTEEGRRGVVEAIDAFEAR